MLKKEITYVDYDGNSRTEDHYFNLTKIEIQEMQVTTEGGFAELLTRIIAALDMPAIYKTFKEIVLKAYGEKSPDGRRFIKSEEISTAFSQTEAYVVLMEEITSDANKAAAFINGIMPKQDANVSSNGAQAAIAPASVPTTI